MQPQPGLQKNMDESNLIVIDLNLMEVNSIVK